MNKMNVLWLFMKLGLLHEDHFQWYYNIRALDHTNIVSFTITMQWSVEFTQLFFISPVLTNSVGLVGLGGEEGGVEDKTSY